MHHDGAPGPGTESPHPSRQHRPIRWMVGGILAALVLSLGILGYSIMTSPRASNAAEVVHRYLTYVHAQEHEKACSLVFTMSGTCTSERHRDLADAYAGWVASGGKLTSDNIYVISGGPGSPADMAWVGIRQNQWEELGLPLPETPLCTYVVAANPPWIPFTDDWVLPMDAFVNRDPAYC